MKENLTYMELIELIGRNPYIRTRPDVIRYLISRTAPNTPLDTSRILLTKEVKRQLEG